MFRKIPTLAVFGLFLALVGCGGAPEQNLNGVWLAQLNDAGGNTPFSFSAQLTQNGGTDVSVTRFGIGLQTCLTEQSNLAATFTKSGSSHGVVLGNFNLTISTTVSASQNNVLTMQGTRGSDGKISGSWTLTGGSAVVTPAIS